MFGLLLIFASFAVSVVHGLPAAPRSVLCPNSNQMASNAACCVWFDVREELLNDVFLNVCQDNVHGNVRLAFHDAGGFSQALVNAGEFGGGGADGSIITFQDIELNGVAQDGSTPNADLLGPVQLSQAVAEHHGVSFGDVIQFGAALGLTLCPGGPVVPFSAGRKNATGPSPPDLVALPDQSVSALLERMADLGNPGFSPAETIALLGSHTAAGQDLVNPDFGGSPFDSTPFIWDTQVFLEVIINDNDAPVPQTSGGTLQNTHVMRLTSDAAFARDGRTSCTWQGFIGQQQKLIDAFEAAMFRISVVGQNPDELIDCSEAIPATAAPLLTPSAFFPPGVALDNLDISCPENGPLPSLPSMSGPVTQVAPIQNQNTPNEPVPSSS